MTVPSDDPTAPLPGSDASTTIVLPVVEERLHVTKRPVVSDRVVVRTRVEQHEQAIETELRTDELTITRVPVDRPVEQAPAIRERDGVTIIPVLEERLVVETRLFLKEEIHIRRNTTVRTERNAMQLRREVVDIARPPRESPQQGNLSDMTMSDTTPITGDTAHDVGSEHHIVATYDTYADARAARDKLMAGGVPSSAVDLLDRNAEPGDASITYEPNTEGFWGAIKRLFMPDEDVHGYAESLERGHAMLVVRPTPEQHDRVLDILETTNAIDFDARQQEWRSSGWTGTHAGQAAYAPPATVAAPVGSGIGTQATSGNAALDTTRGTAMPAAGMTGHTDESIPVVEERLVVGKRDAARGSVRVRSYVVERPVSERVQLREEQVHVDRRPVDRPLGADVADPFRERTIEVSATSEEAVVGKEARVVEEVSLRKDVSERTEEIKDTVRRTEVEIEDGTKLAPQPPARPI